METELEVDHDLGVLRHEAHGGSFAKQPTRVVADMGEHERTYRQFVFFARIAAFAVPFFVAFLLYWTT